MVFKQCKRRLLSLLPRGLDAPSRCRHAPLLTFYSFIHFFFVLFFNRLLVFLHFILRRRFLIPSPSLSLISGHQSLCRCSSVSAPRKRFSRFADSGIPGIGQKTPNFADNYRLIGRKFRCLRSRRRRPCVFLYFWKHVSSLK